MKFLALLRFLLAVCALPLSLTAYILAYLVGATLRFAGKGYTRGYHQGE